MASYTPLKTHSYFRFTSQYIHNFITLAKHKGYNFKRLCQLNKIHTNHIYCLRNGTALYPITLHFLQRVAGTIGCTFDEVAFYHLHVCECGCNPLSKNHKGYKHKSYKKRPKGSTVK